jgi:hypothetical protein
MRPRVCSTWSRVIGSTQPQLAQGGADDAHVVGADGAAGLGGGGGGQLRRQRLAGEGPARAELCGLLQAPARLATGDAQRGGQHVDQRRAAQRFGVGLGGQPPGEPVLDGGQRPADSVEPVQLGQKLRVGQPVNGCGQQRGQPGGEQVDRGDQRVAAGLACQLHDSNTSANHRQTTRSCDQ